MWRLTKKCCIILEVVSVHIHSPFELLLKWTLSDDSHTKYAVLIFWHKHVTNGRRHIHGDLELGLCSVYAYVTTTLMFEFAAKCVVYDIMGTVYTDWYTIYMFGLGDSMFIMCTQISMDRIETKYNETNEHEKNRLLKRWV